MSLTKPFAALMLAIALAALCLAALGLTSVRGNAQDWQAPPRSGQVILAAGFTPDPYTVSVEGGGDIQASARLGDECASHISAAPSFSLTYNAGTFPLSIEAQGSDNIALLIRAPDGVWHCETAAGSRPLTTFNPPQSGQYDVWLGHSRSGATVSARLSISEF